MKSKQFFKGAFILIMLFGMNELAGQQWATNVNHIYNTNTQNVGIGTGGLWTPTAKLHIDNGTGVAGVMAQSNYTSTTQRAIGYFRVSNTATGDIMNISLRKLGSDHEMLQSCYYAAGSLWREYSYLNYTTGKYELRNGITDAEFKNTGNFLVNNLGNVGIKTSTPTANLHVAETNPGYTAVFGTHVSYYDYGTSISIGDDNANAVMHIGQNLEDKGFIFWRYKSDPANAYFSIGAFSGTHPLVLQEAGGNVGIQTLTPQAVLDVNLDNNNYVRLGDNETKPNYFYHKEDGTAGDFQNAIYAKRDRITQNGGLDYSETGINCAIYGYNYWGDPYTFATTGLTYFDNNRCGGVFGAHHSGSPWGSLGYNSSSYNEYGGYFTSSTIGVGKSSQEVFSKIGLAAWGDLFGADIHGKLYGVFTEGEKYALYSHGNMYKDALDVHLHDNGNDTKTILYTNTSTEVTVQTSGIAVLSGGRANIKFDEAFINSISNTEPIIVTVTPLGSSNGVFISEVSVTGFKIMENNAGKSNVTVNYIAVGKRAGFEKPQLAQEVIDAAYVSKLTRGLHNDNDLNTDGEGLYYEDGQLKVGRHFSTLPDADRHVEAPPAVTESHSGVVDPASGARK
jgi:hypothetical protein